MNKTPSTLIQDILTGVQPYELEITFVSLKNQGNVGKLLLEFKSILEKE